MFRKIEAESLNMDDDLVEIKDNDNKNLRIAVSHGIDAKCAVCSLESWMSYRSTCGEYVGKDSWVMRDLWNTAKPPQKEEKGKINEPAKLQSIGVKRLQTCFMGSRDTDRVRGGQEASRVPDRSWIPQVVQNSMRNVWDEANKH